MAMPSKANREIQSLVEVLIDKALMAIEAAQPHVLAAAGTTRLGKIEALPVYSKPSSLEAERRKLNDSILIRVRSKQYSSVAALEPGILESEIRIHAEQENGSAFAIRIPFRQKRPRRVSLGEPTATPVPSRWYASE